MSNQYKKKPLDYDDNYYALCKCCNKESIMYIELMDQYLLDAKGNFVFVYNCPYCDFIFVEPL